MGRKVLIVEDDEGIRSTLESIFEAEGYENIAAIDGLDALDKLNASDPLPNLILLDLMMPRMDGFEFRQAQKKDERFASIPVVIMTADGRAQEKKDMVGAHGYLRKPFRIDEILKVAQTFCPPEPSPTPTSE